MMFKQSSGFLLLSLPLLLGLSEHFRSGGADGAFQFKRGYDGATPPHAGNSADYRPMINPHLNPVGSDKQTHAVVSKQPVTALSPWRRPITTNSASPRRQAQAGPGQQLSQRPIVSNRRSSQSELIAGRRLRQSAAVCENRQVEEKKREMRGKRRGQSIFV
ncbi:uncharacterized protein LOC121900148 isoform X2 [Thunnus maccoyii]|uniref:uncharacterized protein LOC121900148 isoform X2 n=1 Tax=Thunnus maccoyii TaxID=8240 RepID=UPI001C4ADD8B|nr:uncharacterized protein LOC121900148 isoform X2 [Thunnus maccoyii]